MTTMSENNMLVAGEAYVELSCDDAASMGVVSGDVLTVTSDTGSVLLKARLSEQLQPGALFVPAHFREAAVTTLTDSASFPQYVSLSKG
jgi:predicted molibdopterin-dependent oxidoreductase YjgC